MSQKDLDKPNIGSGFEQVRSEGVTKRMGRHVLCDSRRFSRIMQSVQNAPRANRARRRMAWEEPVVTWALNPPILANHHKQRRRKHHLPILSSLALTHSDLHPLAINVADLKVDDLTSSQPGGIRGHQASSILWVLERVEKLSNLQ
jgi:hypothetical protein